MPGLPRLSRIVRPAVSRTLSSILLTLLFAARATAAPTTSADASAYDVHDIENGTGNIYASATKSGGGGPGSCAGRGTAGLGAIAGWCTMTGCVIAFPPFQQICNQGADNSSFSDLVSVVSDAPSGTPVQVQASYQWDGHIDGTGVYGYSSSFDFGSLHVGGPSGSTGGTTAIGVSQPISAAGTQSVAVNTGSAYPIDGQLGVLVADRYCDGGSDNCDASNTTWSMTLSLGGSLTLSVPTLPPGATYVHLVGSGGHDYAGTTTAVDGLLAGREGLSPAWPNPASGTSRLDLTLTRARMIDVGVFDVAGRRVATLTHGELEAGMHPLTWDGRDARGVPAHRGVYFVRARGEGIESTREVLRVS